MYYNPNQTLVSLLGKVNNLDDPMSSWNKKSTILGVTITFMIVSIICICLRLYSRLFIVKSPGWDDVFVVLFMISGSFGSIMICSLTDSGLGQHFLELTLENMSTYLKKFYIANATYCMSATFIKLSLLFQYLGIFRKGTRHRKFTAIMALIIGLWGTAFSFIAWFPCFPVNGYWSFSEKATCYGFGSRYAAEFVTIYECHTGLNMVFDVIVLVIPISIYFEKDTPRRTRLGLIGLFGMGILINTFSIWRLASIVHHRAATYPTFDPTWYAPISLIQACLEVDAASICASIPILWPAILAKFDKISITREVIITREHRRISDFGMGADLELRYSRSSSIGQQESTRSCGESETRLNSTSTQGKSTDYNDPFVLAQVDPLRMDINVSVESRVTVGPSDLGLEKQLSKSLFLKRF